jgi:hypothetical protein
MAECIKQLEGKLCGREARPGSNYCEEHDPTQKHKTEGGGGGGFLNSDRFGRHGKLYAPEK